MDISITEDVETGDKAYLGQLFATVETCFVNVFYCMLVGVS